MPAYYNEIDPFAAAWLRELIKAGLIADGEVDERSVADVAADDVRGFQQCHFFAGIGGWSAALRLAGWVDDRPCWTGSCPCQPWSSAGAALGEDDPRHLWPIWFQLIRQCRPAVVFGEQVAGEDGLFWLDLVYGALEAENYAVGTVDLSGASIGSPDIRPRLWFVADALSERHERERLQLQRGQSQQHQPQVVRDGEAGRMADSHEVGRGSSGRSPLRGESLAAGRGEVGDRWLADADERECGQRGAGPDDSPGGQSHGQPAGPGPTGGLGGFWANAEWIPCRDGKWRPVEPGTFPLATGVSARVGRLRGYGNAIKPEVAQVFIESYLDCEQ